MFLSDTYGVASKLNRIGGNHVDVQCLDHPQCDPDRKCNQQHLGTVVKVRVFVIP